MLKNILKLGKNCIIEAKTSHLLSTSIIKNSQMSTNVQDNKSKRIVWIDLEMSGLNIDIDHILEIASIVTDENLNIIAEGPNIIIKQDDKVLDGMDDWCKKTHGSKIQSYLKGIFLKSNIQYELKKLV
jgi:hypothetical protein